MSEFSILVNGFYSFHFWQEKKEKKREIYVNLCAIDFNLAMFIVQQYSCTCCVDDRCEADIQSTVCWSKSVQSLKPMQ